MIDDSRTLAITNVVFVLLTMFDVSTHCPAFCLSCNSTEIGWICLNGPWTFHVVLEIGFHVKQTRISWFCAAVQNFNCMRIRKIHWGVLLFIRLMQSLKSTEFHIVILTRESGLLYSIASLWVNLLISGTNSQLMLLLLSQACHFREYWHDLKTHLFIHILT